MSVLGTGIAAAVAQTAHQAQQVARQRNRAHAASSHDARRLRELLESHLQAVEEGEEAQNPAQLHIDAQLPEHPSPSVERLSLPKHIPQPRQGEPETSEASADGAEPPLYRHLDIKA